MDEEKRDDELEGETDPQARIHKAAGDVGDEEWDPEGRLREPEARVSKLAGDETSGEWPEARVHKVGEDEEANPDEADIIKWGSKEEG